MHRRLRRKHQRGTSRTPIPQEESDASRPGVEAQRPALSTAPSHEHRYRFLRQVTASPEGATAQLDAFYCEGCLAYALVNPAAQFRDWALNHRSDRTRSRPTWPGWRFSV